MTEEQFEEFCAQEYDRLLSLSYPPACAPEAPEDLTYEEWLATLSPGEHLAETGFWPGETCSDDDYHDSFNVLDYAGQDDYPSLTDDEVARLERVAMYSSVEEYERYEGEDS